MNRLVNTILLSCLFALNSPAGRAEVFSGEDQERRVRTLQTDIHWYKSMTEAEAEAKKEHKMIFWVQMLGDMDGTT